MCAKAIALEVGDKNRPIFTQPHHACVAFHLVPSYIGAMTLLILSIVVILLLSFLASSMEAALFTVSMVRIEQMCDRSLKGSLRLKSNKEKIQDSIIALVVLNNLANIAGSILVGSIAGDLLSSVWLGVFSGGLTFVIIFAGEIVPKTIGEQHAESYARHTAGIVFFLRKGFFPVVALLRWLVRPVSGGNEGREQASEEEITLMARLGHREGTILESENQLIRRVFELNDIAARDIMTPRTVVHALQADLRLDEAAAEIFKTSFSRLPVYEDDLDTVIGVVFTRALLTGLSKNHGDRLVRDYLDPVTFVPESARADALLRLFQRNREHLAIVVDEHGGMAGVISLEDILEQLVGEIVDEYDSDVDLRMKARTMNERRGRGREGFSADRLA